MNNNWRISAFSIMETIVAMAVTAIVMGLIFVVFSIVTERLIDYKNQNQCVSDLNRLTYALNKDIFENEKMETDSSGIVFKNYTGSRVKYLFQPENILRSTIVFTDTFHIKTNRFVMDSLKGESKKGAFLKLTLQTEINKQKLDLQFYKRIYANELIQTKVP